MRLFSRLILLLACSFVLARGAAAQTDARDSFCILPIYDALSKGVPEATMLNEIAKLKAQVGENRKYFKVGFSFIYRNPSTLRDACRLAAANNISLGVIIGLQTHAVHSRIAAVGREDLRQYQWRLDGKTWQGQVVTNKAGNPAYPARDWRVITPSRYAAALQSAYKSETQSQAEGITTLLGEFPGTIVVVNGVIEEELATGDGSDELLGDYSPFAVTEFRDWLRHTGMYDDTTGAFAQQGAPASITGPTVTIAGAERSPFYADPSPNQSAAGRVGKTFNETYGTNFTTWTLASWDLTAFPGAITDANFSPTPAPGSPGATAGGFDAPRKRDPANAYWNAWSWDYHDHGNAYPPGHPASPAFGFRQVMVHHFVNDIMGWAVAAGVPKEIVYAHQIPGETAGAARCRTGADPMWTGLTNFNGHLGVTRFGPFPYDKALAYSSNWGIFEWHPRPGAKADDPALYESTLKALDDCYRHGAHVLFPGWWNNTDSPVFQLTDANFARGLHDWLAKQPDEPLPAVAKP